MESQAALECEGTFPSDDLLTKDGDSGVASSSLNIVYSQQPVKKQTRQWAAWTRQEEENFFNALRQVGKNFEKITCRVQSKNKDQVRHYYYRLVRRMNKLLGPGFSLDAKNSKDTNAAMLRWWSLLEKYSCKASKLHLKPRRFKIFIDALEHQLLKDRKKNIRKRPSQGENSSSGSPTNISLNGRASGHDNRCIKLVIVDGQNIQKVGSGKGSSLKRNNVTTGSNRGNNKADLSTVKAVKQRRRTGSASSAAYKRWERAAIAGVSLVADAAEHLERATTIDRKVAPAEAISNEFCSREFAPTNGQEGINLYNHGTSSNNQVVESSLQPSMKLKLQLFPIDEATRRALEKDEHNPHLELTLSARKKISSVMEHLNRKWGNSSIASGELMLFPYSVQSGNFVGHQRWRQDTAASAADVYATIGSPQVFRLRYGWFSNIELVPVTSRAPSTSLHGQEESVSLNIWNREGNGDAAQIPALPTGHVADQLMSSSKDQLSSVTENTDPISYTDLPEDMTEYIDVDPENNLPEPLEHVPNTSWLRNESGGRMTKRLWEDLDNLKTSSGVSLSAGDWADSLTNMSVGELLTEASHAMETDAIKPPFGGSSQFLQQIPFSCDSFDAAIAAHISGHRERLDQPTAQVPHASSIWDAEETCDAFSFRKIPASVPVVPGPSGAASLENCKHISSSLGFRGLVEELPKKQTEDDPVQEEEPMDNDDYTSKTDDSTKELGSFTDLYWPDSLGPLDLDVPSSRYHGQDLLFSDSIGLSGLNRLIANSLDAFQNCSFFGLDKKEPSSTSEVRVTAAPLVDHKIGGEV